MSGLRRGGLRTGYPGCGFGQGQTRGNRTRPRGAQHNHDARDRDDQSDHQKRARKCHGNAPSSGDRKTVEGSLERILNGASRPFQIASKPFCGIARAQAQDGHAKRAKDQQGFLDDARFHDLTGLLRKAVENPGRCRRPAECLYVLPDLRGFVQSMHGVTARRDHRGPACLRSPAPRSSFRPSRPAPRARRCGKESRGTSNTP